MYGNQSGGSQLSKKQKTLPKQLKKKIMESKKKKMGKGAR